MRDSDSELGELRIDGTNAQVLTSVIGAGGGYIPLHKEPPRYIRVKAHNKKSKEFNHLFLAQELLSKKPSTEETSPGRAPATAVGSKILKGGDAIWAAEFSLDGRYLAVAGKDQIVRVFAVISTPEERKAHEEEEAQNGNHAEKLSAPVFRSKPVREFKGHTGEVLALSWSKNNFLLSSSMDKTVRLWHTSRNDCLCTFPHKDLVTSIAFHPTDDRFFLAGSLDAQLRLWSIPDKDVAFSVSASEFITAVAFSPDGKIAICGVLSGMCTFYETEGLKLKQQIHVRSSRGKNAKGSKITGIRTMKVPSGPSAGQTKVLVSSNDSRVRIYDIDDKLLEIKFKGLENQSSQIHARFSDDGNYVISGSEDRMAYIWPIGQHDAEFKDKHPYECFDAHPEVVTTALMAPTKSRQLLSASGDPIYDLCNPPPVTLLSLEESTASQPNLSDEEQPAKPVIVKKPEETPAYINRTKHFDGNIIITTDRTGTIKVFRQDCAFAKRQQNLWENSSIFSGKLHGVGRSSSILTKTSASSRVQSRRGSLNLGASPIQLQHASDRIMSWRQDVDGRASVSGNAARNERSLSPAKVPRSPVSLSASNLASEARRKPYTSSPASPISRTQAPASPTGSTLSNRTTIRHREKEQENDHGPSRPPMPSFQLISASDTDAREDKGEGGFWNRWKDGITGLRNSATSNPLSQYVYGPHASAVEEETGEDHPTPVGNKGRNRMSLGPHKSSRLHSDEAAHRPRSALPTVVSYAYEADDQADSIDSRLESQEQLSIPKKRVDSGVGRMSNDSKEVEKAR